MLVPVGDFSWQCECERLMSGGNCYVLVSEWIERMRAARQLDKVLKDQAFSSVHVGDLVISKLLCHVTIRQSTRNMQYNQYNTEGVHVARLSVRSTDYAECSELWNWIRPARSFWP